MKVSRILFGLGVGAVAGFAVALRHRDNQSVTHWSSIRITTWNREYETILQWYS